MHDRHYVCEHCGLKWFVPATRVARVDELRCGECEGALRPRDDRYAAGAEMSGADGSAEP